MFDLSRDVEEAHKSLLQDVGRTLRSKSDHVEIVLFVYKLKSWLNNAMFVFINDNDLINFQGLE